VCCLELNPDIPGIRCLDFYAVEAVQRDIEHGAGGDCLVLLQVGDLGHVVVVGLECGVLAIEGGIVVV
jgi:hypothetical protein